MIRKDFDRRTTPSCTKVCHPVTNFDQKLADLLDDMTATLKDAQRPGPGRAPDRHPPPGVHRAQRPGGIPGAGEP